MKKKILFAALIAAAAAAAASAQSAPRRVVELTRVGGEGCRPNIGSGSGSSTNSTALSGGLDDCVVTGVLSASAGET